MKFLLFVLSVCLVSSPASACMAEPVPQAMIYKTKPSDSSPDTTIVKAKIIEKLPKSWTIRVRVLEGPVEFQKATLLVNPTEFSSCTTFGRDIGYMAVKSDPNSKEPNRFVAEVFERSWMDWIIDFLGGDPYFFSSDRVIPMHLSLSE